LALQRWHVLAPLTGVLFVALAVTAGSALVATGATAAAVHVASWVPITLGSVGGTFVVLLLLDLLRGDRR